MTPRTPTRAEIAASFHLWSEYVDPSGVDSREDFDAMTHAAKIAFMDVCFGSEIDDATTMNAFRDLVRNDNERADASAAAYNAALERGGSQDACDVAAETAYDECRSRQRRAAEQAYQDNHR